MRRHNANDRLIANELIAAAVDGPENATFVRSGCQLSVSAALEVTAGSGTVTITGSDVSVSEQSETVTDISGQTANTPYRYHTFSVDDTGTLQIQSSNIGDFDASTPDQPPTTQVTEPRHPVGNVYLGVAFQIGDAIEEIYDGRYIVGAQPNDIITQGQGSGLDADTLRGATNDDFKVPLFGDGDDGDVTYSSDTTLFETVAGTTVTIDSAVTITPDSSVVTIYATDTININGTIDVSAAGGNGGGGGSGGGINSNGNGGEDGQQVDFISEFAAGGNAEENGINGSGGGGSSTSQGNGGDGGDVLAPNARKNDIRGGLSSAAFGRMSNTLSTVGSGGGGGGGGAGDDVDSGNAGGGGGAGGGGVFLVAPNITGGGSVIADGSNGADGNDGSAGNGGGGGGGHGGVVVYAGRDIDRSNLSESVAGGSGGSGPGSAGDGGNGRDGLIIQIDSF